VAVKYVDRIWSSAVKTTVNPDGGVQVSGQIRYNVFVDNPDDNEMLVRQNPLLPQEFQIHPDVLNMYCNGVDVSRKGPLHFEVTATYASQELYEGEENREPPDQPSQISFFTITSEEPIDEDIHGDPIATVNGEPVNGITRPISDLGIRVSKNFRVFNPASFYQFIDCVNSDTFLGFPAGTLRVANISADRQYYTTSQNQQVFFWAVQVEIHARKPYRTTPAKAWWKRYRHEGYYVKDQSTGDLVRAVDGNNEPTAQPVQLLFDGSKAPDQTVGLWLESQIFSTVAFASMGL
jgi:hypothetical protein